MLFELSQINKTYGNIRALRGFSVAVPHGAIGLLGPNGAGKTTLIRAILGLIRPDSGSGSVLDLDIATEQLAIRQAVGFVPEDECLFPGVVGIEFTAYAGELAGMNRKDALQRAHEVLDYTGLGEARYRRVESYSTGMKQRIKLAAAIVHDPKLLILDEPTNGLDPKGRDEVLALTRDLSVAKGMSLLFSSHLLPDVESVCDHVMVMSKGRLIAQGSLSDLKELHQQTYEIRVKHNPAGYVQALQAVNCQATLNEELIEAHFAEGQDAQLLWQVAVQHGEQIRHLRPKRGTLEEVFLKAVRDGE